MSWYDGIALRPLTEYVSHILVELGRLGLEVEQIERHDRPPNTKTVLSDLLNWLDDHPGEAFAKLVNWQALDFVQMRSRLERNWKAKPRIELSAHITKMNNLSVRWHPGGWRNTDYNWGATDRASLNLIKQQKWSTPPDFHSFTGDEEPTFNSRPSNELMYIRGVGNLNSEPCDSYGPYASYNRDVLDALLICAVRAAYEGLIKQLDHSFEVDVLDAFDFVTRNEFDEDDALSLKFPTRRVVSWSLEGAKELGRRREQQAALEHEERARAELTNMAARHGFTLEEFVAALLQVAVKKAIGPAPSSETINRNAAKNLRIAGFKVDAADVRRLRGHLVNCMPDILPEPVRVDLRAPSEVAPEIVNILRFPSGENGDG